MTKRRLTIMGMLALAVAFRPASADGPAAKDHDDLAKYDARIKPANRRHWAYLPIKKPATPQVRDPAWARNPIDAFVLAGLEKDAWRPSSPASPRALLR